MPRFKTLRQDIASLNDYDAHLTNKVQFLLDAVLGFINIAQNNIIKVLTVVSVVGVPPDPGRQHLRHELQGHARNSNGRGAIRTGSC